MEEITTKKVRLFVFVGAYGSGKSEVSVHFARKLKRENPDSRIMLADLDIVNPFYRSVDAKEILEGEGIHVVSPIYANTNVDVPSLPGEIYSAFDDETVTAVFDIGGEDLGARVLGSMLTRFSHIEYRVYMVVNAFRPFTSDATAIRMMAEELSEAARLPIHGFINNSNLLADTTEEELIHGERILDEAEKETGIPVVYLSGLDDVLPKVWGDRSPKNIELLRMNRNIHYRY
ncbi:MAG TPA: hypothetical protein PK567_05025 [Bacillota bacterium]|nr:hypothetical protein [Bacillota bacterium]